MTTDTKPRFDAEEVKARYRLSDVIGRSVKLVRQGAEFSGLCPFHNEKSPSFTVNDQKRFYHCFGCGAHGSVIDWVMHERGLDFAQALAELGREVGLEPAVMPKRRWREKPDYSPDADTMARRDLAAAIWHEARPGAGTIVETYLRARGITGAVPPSLKFHPACPASVGADGRIYYRAPAMVAAVLSPAKKLLAIHRTFLLPDGSGKQLVGRAKPTAKKMLASAGGGAVRLSPPRSTLHTGEGIETSLSILDGLGGPEAACVWASLSLGGFGNLLLPDWVRQVVIWADNEKPGALEKAIGQAAKLRASQGVPVRVLPSPKGMDPNDWRRALLAAPEQERGA